MGLNRVDVGDDADAALAVDSFISEFKLRSGIVYACSILSNTQIGLLSILSRFKSKIQ